MPHRTVTQLKGRFYKKLKSHYEEERRNHLQESTQRVYSLRSRRTPNDKIEEVKEGADSELKEMCLNCKAPSASLPGLPTGEKVEHEKV